MKMALHYEPQNHIDDVIPQLLSNERYVSAELGVRTGIPTYTILPSSRSEGRSGGGEPAQLDAAIDVGLLMPDLGASSSSMASPT